MRILLVDNDRLLLESLCVALEARHAGLEVQMASSEDDALAVAQAQAQSAPFELILLDWWLGEEPARRCFERLHEACPLARIVVMSGDDSPGLVHEVLELRAAGFLSKNAGGFAAMREALDVVAKGGVYLPGVVPGPHAVSPSVRQRWVGRELREAFPQLTPRQLAVLRVLLRGASDKVIARELDIALTTVKTHVAEVLHRLGVAGRAEAVALAARKGVRLD